MVQVHKFGSGTWCELEIYISVKKELKLKVRRFYRLILAFVEVTGGKTGFDWENYFDWEKIESFKPIFLTRKFLTEEL